ncbi:exodeoxyribonuclease V beta chain domain protein [Mycobacterium xenopi 4042]|uniref:Exodeoxyribonuclease V beta chain domain protein n=1 Tax=Mycobacterium xenopi 4042 TaxID=1299334 RepID=X7Z1N0_MYCXE|nr:exodeoxyribonuclease V beta chain domain protein [Mycobacterium xenopi 4042]
MDRFDLLGPLPRDGSTTVLEASAGTGKTFAWPRWSPAISPRPASRSTKCC